MGDTIAGFSKPRSLEEKPQVLLAPAHGSNQTGSFQGRQGGFNSALKLESSGASRSQKMMRLTLLPRIHSPEDPAGPAMPLQAYTVQALIFST